MAAPPPRQRRYAEEEIFGPGALAFVLAGFAFWPLIGIGIGTAFVVFLVVAAAVFAGVSNSRRLESWPSAGGVILWAFIAVVVFLAIAFFGIPDLGNLEELAESEELAEEAFSRLSGFAIAGYIASFIVFASAMAVSLAKHIGRRDATTQP